MNVEGGEPPASKGSRFCPGCGISLDEKAEFCPQCGRSVGMTNHYAAQYGISYGPARSSSLTDTIRSMGRGVAAFAILPLIVLLCVDAAILVWGITLVYPISQDPVHHVGIFIILPTPDPLVNLFDLSGVWFMGFYLFLVAAIVASFVWMLYQSLGPFRKELGFEKPKEGHSPLFTMATIFFAIIAFDTIYAIILILLGINPTAPDFGTGDLWQLIYGFARAAVWEELLSRVAYLGIPLLLIGLAIKEKKPLRRYILGGGFTLGGKELAFIWISAGIFALAHIVSWDLWKIVPTWVAGLAFGYLFLRVGLYACIMLHFTVDYLSLPMDVTNSLAVTLILGLLILAWEVVGAGYLAVFTRRSILWVTGRDKKAKPAAAAPPPFIPYPPSGPYYPQPPSQGQTPPAYQTRSGIGQGFFVCTKCGYTEAKYKDGQLECLRCGAKY